MYVADLLLQWTAAALWTALFCRALWLSRPAAHDAAARYRRGVHLSRAAAATAVLMLLFSAARGDWFVAAAWVCGIVPGLLSSWMIERTAQIHLQREQLDVQLSALQQQLSGGSSIDIGDTEGA